MTLLGSPPPMRGKDCSHMILRYSTRITPAYAGKRRYGSCANGTARDHPRLCGEKFASPAPRVNGIGSPPPMRGKGCHVVFLSFHFRITPAYAGKSPFLFSICGGGTGSPPPMRGKVCRYDRPHTAARDHPRLCGEKTKKIPKQRYFFHQPASFSFSLQYT